MDLETPRLRLRDFEEADWHAVHEYATDPEVFRHLEWGPNTEEETRGFVGYAVALARESPRSHFELAVIRRSDGRLIGGCGVRLRDRVNRSGDLGYTLRRDQWGMGYATELAGALSTFGFERLGMHRIWATCRPENVGSVRVLEKIGMRGEGLLQHEKRIRGEWKDSLLFAMLAPESAGA